VPPGSYPYQQQPWQQPAQQYAYGQHTYSGYPPQAYGQPQAYPQSFQAFNQPQMAYSQAFQPGYTTAHYPPQTQSAASAHPSQPQSAWSTQSSYPQNSPPQTNNVSESIPPRQRNNSASLHKFSPPPVDTFKENANFVSLDATFISPTADDLTEDFFSESYFASHPEELDPNLSLGFITWHPPLPTKRPLPATFNEAEIEAIAPRKPLPTDDEAISDFFIFEKRHDAYISVRQTERWDQLKDSIIFKEIPAQCAEYLTASEVDAYKLRHDRQWSPSFAEATPESESQEQMDTVEGATNSSAPRDPPSTARGDSTNQPLYLLDSLEGAPKPDRPPQASQHSRHMSTSSATAQPLNRPRPLMPVRDQQQEDVLAALGVTGSPKIVYETPGPAFGAPQPQRANSNSNTGRPTSSTSDRGAPPTRQSSASHKPWESNGHGYSNGRPGSRPGSNSSQHTAHASGTGGDEEQRTPRPTANGTESRKRAFDDTEGVGLANIPEHDEDATPRPRHKHPRVDDTYR
jgi:hypothetical protein